MTDEDFLSFLTIAVANINYGQRPNRKTQIDLRTYWQGLSGLPITAHAQWEPFDDKAYDELLCTISAGLHKEAKRRYLLKISG